MDINVMFEQAWVLLSKTNGIKMGAFAVHSTCDEIFDEFTPIRIVRCTTGIIEIYNGTIDQFNALFKRIISIDVHGKSIDIDYYYD